MLLLLQQRRRHCWKGDEWVKLWMADGQAEWHPTANGQRHTVKLAVARRNNKRPAAVHSTNTEQTWSVCGRYEMDYLPGWHYTVWNLPSVTSLYWVTAHLSSVVTRFESKFHVISYKHSVQLYSLSKNIRAELLKVRWSEKQDDSLDAVNICLKISIMKSWTDQDWTLKVFSFHIVFIHKNLCSTESIERRLKSASSTSSSLFNLHTPEKM